MLRLWRLAIASCSANLGRSLAAALSVAVGVGIVVVITCFYETAWRALRETVAGDLLGSGHVSIHPPGAHWGSLDASLMERLRPLENVENVTGRLHRRMRLAHGRNIDSLVEDRWWSVDAIGIRPEWERGRADPPDLEGRMPAAGERGAAVIEREQAAFFGLRVGDKVTLSRVPGAPRAEFTVVGVFASRRAAEFQRPVVYVALEDLQALTAEANVVSVIDVSLGDASIDNLNRAKATVERTIDEFGPAYPYRVESAAGRQLVLTEAERITRLVLSLIAFIALMTSFFIILTTQTMSLVQRRGQLGVMRCVGMTRAQAAALIGLEVIPLGTIGVVIGVFGGLALTHAIGLAVAEATVVISVWGIGLASISGMAATILSTGFLIAQVTAIAPLEAVSFQARPARRALAIAVSAVGLVLLGVHHLMVLTPDQNRWLEAGFASAGAGSLHLGYVLLAPGIILLLGPPVARGAGRLMRLPGELAAGEFVRAPWRTTGACWVLMVGLSLIVYLAVRLEAVHAIWDFPARLPQVFVWSQDYVPGETIERVSRLPGVARVTVTTDVECEIETPDAKRTAAESMVERFLRKLTRPVFVAGEPERLLSMIKVVFTEGERDEILAKMKRGGYVVIPPQTSRNKNLHLGDRISVTMGDRTAEFEVAGVVQSPALDVAVTAFQAETYMQFAAASAILGSREDLKDRFGLDVVSMFMCDLELEPTPVPDGFPPSPYSDVVADYEAEAAAAKYFVGYMSGMPEERDVAERLAEALESNQLDKTRQDLRRFARVWQWFGWSSMVKRLSREEQWMQFRERLLLLRIAYEMERPDAVMGSLRQLKQEIDRRLRLATVTLTWLPSMLLAAAAVGVANLMMVSVHQRARSIAVLRAVGADRSQILRMVLAESITIGLLGSVMGLALGLHEAYSLNQITEGVVAVTLDFIVPYGTVSLAVLLTVGVCVLAGIPPARRAAGENVVAALQAT